MSRIIVVTGQSGVGKDFLVEKANPKSFGIKHVNWGDIFSRLVNDDKDNLANVYVPDAATTMAIQNKVTQEVISLEPVIVTSHPVKIEQGVEFVNWDIEKTISPSDYIFIRALPEIIADRVQKRNAAGLRKTPELTVQEIAKMQDRKLELMAELADHVGGRLTVIDNFDDNVHQNVQQIRQVMNRIK